MPLTDSRSFSDTDAPKPPSWLLWVLEGRALWELGASILSVPILKTAPAGDGHPVLVLPGLVTDDLATFVLRNFLLERGYATYAWELGLNLGPRPGVVESLVERVMKLRARHGRTVSLVGWSLGGIYAREIAKVVPGDVRLVVTLGSPFAGNLRATNAWRLYELCSGKPIGSDPRMAGLSSTPLVPTTSIYSRTDGVVAWQCCVERESDRSENIEIHASHFGMGMNPTALYAIADRLGQPEGMWRRFDHNGLEGFKRLLYRSPYLHAAG